MSKKIIIGLFLTTAIILIVFGFLRKSQNGSSHASPDLTVLIQSPPLTLDPVATMELDSAFVGNAAHTPLIRIGSKGEVLPMLATEIRVAPDAMSATIKLKEGCKFWDGSPVTSKDVESSLTRLQQSENPLKFVVSRIGGFTVINPLELIVRFSKPEPEFVANVAHLQASITKADSEKSPKLPFDQHVIGAGAWVPERLESGVRFRFRSNLGFPGTEQSKSLTFLVKSETQARITAFQSGEAQVIRLRGPETREFLVDTGNTGLRARKEFPATVITEASSSDGSAIMINWSNPVLAKMTSAQRIEMVKALSRNIPRQAISKTLMAAEPFWGVVPTTALPLSGEVENLSEQSAPGISEFSLPSPIEVELLAANDAASRELASLVEPAFRSVGLKVKLRFADIGTLVNSVIKKEHQFCITYFEMPIPGPEGWLMFFDENNPFSAFGQPLPRIREGIEKAKGTIDPIQRLKSWQTVASEVNRQQTGWIPLFSRHTLILSNAKVSGIIIDGCGTPVWSNLRMRE